MGKPGLANATGNRQRSGHGRQQLSGRTQWPARGKEVIRALLWGISKVLRQTSPSMPSMGQQQIQWRPALFQAGLTAMRRNSVRLRSGQALALRLAIGRQRDALTGDGFQAQGLCGSILPSKARPTVLAWIVAQPQRRLSWLCRSLPDGASRAVAHGQRRDHRGRVNGAARCMDFHRGVSACTQSASSRASIRLATVCACTRNSGTAMLSHKRPTRRLPSV